MFEFGAGKRYNKGMDENRGGKRVGAGRKTAAQKNLEAEAKARGKSIDELLEEAKAGFVEALNLLATAMPDIVAGMITRASRGDEITARFLTATFFKHMQINFSPADNSPIRDLLGGMRNILVEAEADGILKTSPVGKVTEGVYRNLEEQAAPGTGADPIRSDAD